MRARPDPPPATLRRTDRLPRPSHEALQTHRRNNGFRSQPRSCRGRRDPHLGGHRRGVRLDIQVVGVILMIVGLVGFLLSMFLVVVGRPGLRRRAGSTRTSTTARSSGRAPGVLGLRAGAVGRGSGRPAAALRGPAARAGSSTTKSEPSPVAALDPDAAVHPADELAADVEAEPGAADARGSGPGRGGRTSRRSRSCSAARDAEPLVGDDEADAVARRARAAPRRGRRPAST